MGSRLLLLVQVQLGENQDRIHHRGHVRQQSDDLMDDLELQLGSTNIVYLQVRLTYSSYSASSQREKAASAYVTAAAETTQHTRVETIVTARIKRHNSSSPWSPPPVPSPNPLLEIAASHWGLSTTADVFQRLATSSQPPTPRKPAHLLPHRAVVSANTSTPSPTTSTSAGQRTSTNTTTTPTTLRLPSDASLRDSKPDPARKIWSEIRRASTSRRPPSSSSPAAFPSPGFGGPRCSYDEPSSPARHGCIGRARSARRAAGKEPEVLRVVARDRHSVGAETPRSVVSSAVGGASGEGVNGSGRSERSGGSRSLNGGRSKRDGGRWSWAAWW